MTLVPCSSSSCASCSGDALFSELHRRECEARHVLKFSSEGQASYYKAVDQARGRKALELLIYDVEKERESRLRKV